MTRPIYLYVGDSIGEVELVQHSGDDLMCVNAARVSFAKRKDLLDSKDKDLIHYLLMNNHTSPFEHCHITWRFKVPLFVRSQHHRHRTWSYNEVSRRYVDDTPEFYIPDKFRKKIEGQKQATREEYHNPEIGVPRTDDINMNLYGILGGPASHSIAYMCEHLKRMYERLLEKGIPPEQARMILPMNTYTEYYGTVSLHNALKFLMLRLDPHAQWEIRMIAEAMLTDLLKLYPVTMEVFSRIRRSKELMARMLKAMDYDLDRLEDYVDDEERFV